MRATREGQVKKLRAGCCAWWGQMAPAAVILALAVMAMAGSAKADIVDAFVQVNIYYGVSQLYSPTNVLLSTTVDMTVETQFDYSQTIASGQGSLITYFMPLMDQAVVDQLPGYPGAPPVPAYILDNLASFENSDGLGAEDDSTNYAVDPNGSPSPSALELYLALTTQPVPFDVTSDTGFVQLGAMDDYVAVFGPFGPLPGTVADTIEGGTNVNIFERDLQLQETSAAPVPEPGSLGLLGMMAGLTLWKHRKKMNGSR